MQGKRELWTVYLDWKQQTSILAYERFSEFHHLHRHLPLPLSNVVLNQNQTNPTFTFSYEQPDKSVLWIDYNVMSTTPNQQSKYSSLMKFFQSIPPEALGDTLFINAGKSTLEGQLNSSLSVSAALSATSYKWVNVLAFRQALPIQELFFTWSH